MQADENVDLPLPEGPRMQATSPAREGQVDTFQHLVAKPKDFSDAIYASTTARIEEAFTAVIRAHRS